MNRARVIPLRSGKTVGLLSPAGAVEPQQIQQGIDCLRQQGFPCITAAHALGNHGIVSGTVTERLDDLYELWKDPAVAAVWALRGGYGSMQLLPRLDFSRLLQPPKWLVGFSDLTAFQWALYQQIRLPALSGFTLTSQLHADNPFLQLGMQILSGLRNSIAQTDIGIAPLQVHQGGTAQGTLLGGTLSMICALCGTPFFPQRDELILLLEDVNEPLYRIDRLLQQLGMMGFWRQVRAVLLGRFIYGEGELDVVPLLHRHLRPGTLLISGYPYGHYSDACPMPLGVAAQLQSEPFKLVWESPVSS